MSREILFRGKIIEPCEYQGQWLEGFYAVENGKPFIAIPKENGLNGFYCDPETVGQYTGLKDKNGKKIFEGDVVKGASEYFCNSSLNQKAVVLYDRGQFVFAFGETLTDCKQLEDFEVVAGWNGDVEVIGNIYDNPELAFFN